MLSSGLTEAIRLSDSGWRRRDKSLPDCRWVWELSVLPAGRFRWCGSAECWACDSRRMAPLPLRKSSKTAPRNRRNCNLATSCFVSTMRTFPTVNSMINLIRQHEPGQTVQLKIKRGEEELDFAVTLTHPFGQFLSRIAEQNRMGGELSDLRSGFPAVIQHDTVLQPDECGGAVVGLDGRCIGINIARAGRTESYAIPAAVILPLLNERMRLGKGDAASLPPAPPVAVRNGD